jgi:hypothetical protein
MITKYLSEYRSFYGFRLYDVLDDAVLLRCQGGESSDEGSSGDIDLIFLGTEYVELPILLRGVHITKPRDEFALSLERLYTPNRISEPGERVYAIESGGNRFHIIASNFWIQVCHTHSKTSSLIYLLSDNFTERDAYCSEQVKERYKIE